MINIFYLYKLYLNVNNIKINNNIKNKKKQNMKI